ncbi:MAG TPA: DMT family transporter [Alphaproteobacteria bacterium]|nr:DMT family transporter [Alphaproteobacteria bacterium]
MAPIRAATALDVFKLFLLGGIWGSAFLCIAIALEGLPPTSIAAGRIALAGAALGAVAWGRGARLPRDGKTWALIILIGALNSAVPFLLISWGQQAIASSRAAILMATGPFAVLALSHLFTRDDRLTLPKLAGVVLGFAGVVLLVGFDAVIGDHASVAGQLAVVGAALCYAVSALLTRKAAHVPPLALSATVLGSAALYMVPAALLYDRPWELAPGWDSLAAVLFLGLFPTGLAYLLRFQIINDVGMTFMSQVSYLVPIFGVLWGWLFLAEMPTPAAWGALALVLAGIAISRLGPARRIRPRATGAPV